MTDLPQTYIDWNDAFAGHFFLPEKIGQSVYLSVDDELVHQLGDVDTFISAVKHGPAFIDKSDGLCAKAFHVYEYWKKSRSGLEYPPYIAYLCLFVLAASREDNRFAKHAYYPKLRSLIGETLEARALPSFHHMYELWDDLEHWANQEKRGELGLFEVRIAGSWFHVGIPIAQVILSPSERASLPVIFSRADLDPASSPSDLQLALLVHDNEYGLLRNRTKRMLQKPDLEDDACQVLLQTLRDELENWDGIIEELDETSTTKHKKMLGGLRLCLKLDRVASSVTARLRCRFTRDCPDGIEILKLRPRNNGETLTAFEQFPGWSSELRLSSTDHEIDAAQIAWNESFEIEEEQLGWRFRMSTYPVRIFKSAASEGLPGLVEIQSIPQNEKFYIACHASETRRVEEWLSKDCKGTKSIALNQGIPYDWRLFEVGSVLTVDRISKVYPNVGFSQILRILFKDGVKISYGNSYFAFCPPKIRLEGSSGNEIVVCNEIELKQTPGIPSEYVLPTSLPMDQTLKIEVRKEAAGDPVARRSFVLTKHVNLEPHAEKAITINRFGSEIEQQAIKSDFVSGALVNSSLIPDYSYQVLPETFGSQSVLLLGAEPGQIADWPKEHVPTEWQPIWAIAVNHKRAIAVFCGIEMVEPQNSTKAETSLGAVKHWKEYLWHWRKRIAPPRPQRLQRLWRKYIEFAKNV